MILTNINTLKCVLYFMMIKDDCNRHPIYPFPIYCFSKPFLDGYFVEKLLWKEYNHLFNYRVMTLIMPSLFIDIIHNPL